MNYFNEEQHAFWKENGFIHLKNHLSQEKAESIGNWVLEVDSWPETPGKWMKYFERSSNGNNRQLCRVENFIPYHDEFKNFLCGKEIYGMVSELMNEEAVLFKEKINYKYPGGGGFAAQGSQVTGLT